MKFKGKTCVVTGGANGIGLSRKGILSGCPAEDFNYVLRVGITAPYELTRLFMPYFRPGASIVNISSTRAVMSQADTESYSAAKGGISALTHALAVSLSHCVRVNSVNPGWIDTSAWHGMPGAAPKPGNAALNAVYDTDSPEPFLEIPVGLSSADMHPEMQGCCFRNFMTDELRVNSLSLRARMLRQKGKKWTIRKNFISCGRMPMKSHRRKWS